MSTSRRRSRRRAALTSALATTALFAMVLTACGTTDAHVERAAATSQPVSGSGGSTPSTDGRSKDGSAQVDTGASGAAGDDGDAAAGDPTPTGEPTGDPITIAFAGDASFEGLEARVTADPQGLLKAITPVLSKADLAMVNLEAAVTTGDTGAKVAKTFNFRTPPAALQALSAAGVDVVTMANNHALDFGAGGLEQTLEAERTEGVPIIGIGKDEADAFAPWVAEVRGRRIAFIAASDVIDSHLIPTWQATATRGGVALAKQPERLLEEVRAARGQADTVVVFMHWGTERLTCPNDRQPPLAKALVDAGADIVVGAHSHRLVGGGYLGSAFVHYGLGNFIFKAPSAVGNASGVVTVSVDGRKVLDHTWTPATIRNLVPVPLSGAEATRAEASWKSLRSCTGLAAEPTAPTP